MVCIKGNLPEGNLQNLKTKFSGTWKIVGISPRINHVFESMPPVNRIYLFWPFCFQNHMYFKRWLEWTSSKFQLLKVLASKRVLFCCKPYNALLINFYILYLQKKQLLQFRSCVQCCFKINQWWTIFQHSLR